MKKTTVTVDLGVRMLMVLLLTSALAGCASSNKAVFIDRAANFAAVQRVAVLPLQNFSNTAHAAEKVEQILTIELLRAQAFDLVTSGDVRRALAELEVESLRNLTPEQMRQIGERLEVQSLLMGTVRELDIDRSGGIAAPVLSLHFEMADPNTGAIIWSTVVSRHGAGASARLFGLGGTSTNEAIQDLVREALRTLIR